jgi:hypothetical protein
MAQFHPYSSLLVTTTGQRHFDVDMTSDDDADDVDNDNGDNNPSSNNIHVDGGTDNGDTVIRMNVDRSTGDGFPGSSACENSSFRPNRTRRTSTKTNFTSGLQLWKIGRKAPPEHAFTSINSDSNCDMALSNNCIDNDISSINEGSQNTGQD